MNERKRPVSYDVVETANHILFTLDAPSFASIDRITIVPGHGLEAYTSTGISVRFANLHANLISSCMEKPIMIVSIADGSASAASVPGDTLCDHPDSWFPDSFYWFLDPPGDLSALRERPLVRLLEMMKTGIVAAASGRHTAGPPIALCKRSSRVLAFPSGREWIKATSSLVIDGAILDGGTASHAASSDIDASVASAFLSTLPPIRLPVGQWRSQLAIVL